MWKAVDPEGDLLTKIFEVCRKERRIPSAWRESLTILLYKKGELDNPCNWRPIAPQSAIYKVYAALWARRLATWAGEARAISPAQKGFVVGEGCYEHSFLLRSMTEGVRRKNAPLHLVFFDLKNAFGSVPHNLLWFTLRQLVVLEEIVEIVQTSTRTARSGCRRGQHVPGADGGRNDWGYPSGSGSETRLSRVQTEGRMTGAIHQGRGVKQGCPLSPLLFNLAIEGLLRGIETTEATGYSFSEGAAVRVLAYADDLVVTSSSEEDARALVARMEEFASWARLSFRVEKCASLSTSYRGGKELSSPQNSPSGEEPFQR